MTKTKKNMVIMTAMAAILAVSGISAYFTATDAAVNTFTVGKVTIEQQEPDWTPDPDDIVPNQEFGKDPQVKNTGDNPAYVFEVIRVPHKNVITSNTTTGAKANAAAKTQLFQLNKTKDSVAANAWTGNDTYHDEAWYLLATDPAGSDTENYTTYVFAYGSGTACAELAAGATTAKPVFESVTFANVIENQGLENSDLSIKVNGFAIQKDNIANNSSGAVTPAAVWAVLNTQDAAIASLS